MYGSQVSVQNQANRIQMLVVPAEEQKAGINVALRFFQLTYGSISPNAQAIAPRILAAFMGISALGKDTCEQT